MTYTVYVHNNAPAYEGKNKKKAQEAFDAEVTRTLDGIGPIETIEMMQDGKTISCYEDGELTEPVPVIFRAFRTHPRHVVAILPTLHGDQHRYTCQSYEHVGQHGACDPQELVRMTRPAQPAEYAFLLAEMKGLGYILDVKSRITNAMQEKKYDTIRKNEYDALHNKD